MDKISIIVAIYKSEKFLPKLLDSIAAQTYSDFEAILVDDGSPDHSGGICDDYATKDNRFIVIHKENGGACEARNYGLSKITGEYLTVIDGDDWLEPDYLEYFMEMIKRTGAEMAMSDHIFTTRDRIQTQNDKIEKWTGEDAATAIIYQKIPVGPWSKLYKTSLIRNNNLSFSVPWSGEGLYFSCMAAEYANFVAVGHRKVYNYRLNNTNSGLTHYNVTMGTNSIENVRYIGEVSVIKSPKFMRAINWHLWANYYYILFLILGTHTEKTDNKDLYQECLKNIHSRLLRVLRESDFSTKHKIKMLLQGIFPVYFAKRELATAQEALAKDTME